MADGLSIENYDSVPTMDAAGGVALGVALLSALPTGAPEAVKEPAQQVRASTLALQQSWAARAVATEPSARPVDTRVDNAWAALHGALSAAARLPESSPRHQAATPLLGRLFSDGLRFTRLKFEREWAESDRRLQAIAKEGLEAPISTAVGGPEFLEEVRAAHDAYGKALNITTAGSAPLDVNLADDLRALRSAITDYALQVVAWSRQQGGANFEAARQALHPIDAAREAEARRSSGASAARPDVTPETPVPPVA